MLRRPPTVLTLTSEDVKAYEDLREAQAFQHTTAAAQATRHQQLTRNMSGMDVVGITTSSDDEDYSEQEVSHHPTRTHGPNTRIFQEDHTDGPRDEEIYRNEEDSDDYEDASEAGDPIREGGFIEDEDMAEAEAEEQMDLDADNNNNNHDNNSSSSNSISTTGSAPHPQQAQQQQQQPEFPSPPPAPARMTRSTRSASREPSSSSSQQPSQQQQQQQHHTAAQQPARLARAGAGAQTHRRAHSGRAADATTPTPVAQAQREAAERVRSRATRSRDERIGVARGGRRL